MNKKINAISLFSSAGIGELLFDDSNINIVCANELIEKRSECYRFLHKNTVMINGDICDENTKEQILQYASKHKCKLLLATPPCQGFSTLGKNKHQDHYEKDPRNFLIFHVFEIFERHKFDYLLIENVPTFLNMYFPYNGEMLKVVDIIKKKYSEKYNVDFEVLNAKDYGICQLRSRCFIKIYKKSSKWPWPSKEPEIHLESAIGYLPSLEAGEKSDIPWHYAKKENPRIVLALKHTPTGKSAIYNSVYYPKKEDGTRIKGFHNTFKRMDWDMPAPARTTYSGSMSSHNNVHPGRPLSDGTFSDARVLTLLETFIVSSIPTSIEFPKWATDTFIRTMIGEAVPPLLLKKVLDTIKE